MSSPRVQLYILSRNRVEFLRETLHSAVAQTYDNLDIIVSDNSTNDEVAILIQNEFSNSVKIVRRNPPVSSNEHFDRIRTEVSAEYYMLFHDDDIMFPNLVSELMNAMLANPNCVCACANALLMLNSQRTQTLFNSHLQYDTIFDDDLKFVSHYLDYRKNCLPFPGYLYKKTDQLIEVHETEAGKYGDCILILKHLKFGSIIWLKSPMMYYRFHSSNDSKGIDLLGAFRLIRTIERITGLSRKSNLSRQYLIGRLTNYVKNQNKKRRMILPILAVYFLKHPFYFAFKTMHAFKNRIRASKK